MTKTKSLYGLNEGLKRPGVGDCLIYKSDGRRVAILFSCVPSSVIRGTYSYAYPQFYYYYGTITITSRCSPGLMNNNTHWQAKLFPTPTS